MHHDSDWNYVNRADQNRVPNLSRARFDYKRKDEDDMAKSTKTYEERIRALEKKEQESIEATKKLIAFAMHRRCSRGVSYRRLHHRIYRQLPESENNDKEDSLQIITCIEISFLQLTTSNVSICLTI